MVTTSKSEWYKLLLDKSEAALKNEFYFEAIFISYMIIDDRIKSLCKARGIKLTKTIRGKVKDKTLGELINELNQSRRKLERKGFFHFSEPVCVADNKETKDIQNDTSFSYHLKEYLGSPKKLYSTMKKNGTTNSLYSWDDDNIHGFLEYIYIWVDQRNYWMHGAGSAKISKNDLNVILRPLALDGVILARFLCDWVLSHKSKIVELSKKKTTKKTVSQKATVKKTAKKASKA